MFIVLVGTSHGAITTESQARNELTNVIRNVNNGLESRVAALDTIIGSAEAMRAESVETAARAFRYYLLAEQLSPDVLDEINDVYTLALRLQDYRSQAYALRAKFHIESRVDSPNVFVTKQNLLGLLSRRLSDNEKADILFEIGLGDSRTSNYLSAFDYLGQAESTYWKLGDYSAWRKTIQKEIALYAKLNWYAQAIDKQLKVVEFSQSKDSALPYIEIIKLMPLLQGVGDWPEIERYALLLLEFGQEENHAMSQFEAAHWLIKVNLEKGEYRLARQWMNTLESWIAQHKQLKMLPDIELDKADLLVAEKKLSQASSLLNTVEPSLTDTENSQHALRYHLISTRLALSEQRIDDVVEGYEHVLQTQQQEFQKLLLATVNQVGEDYARLAQLSQETIQSLKRDVAIRDEAIAKEAVFNNLLISILVIMGVVIAVMSYFYLRLKNQKQAERRRRSK